MNETWLRWEARIGSLKGLAVLALLILLFVAIPIGQSVYRALKNPSGYESSEVAQFARGDIAVDKFVTVSGLAAYDLAYRETEDGAPVAIYYPLIDRDSGTVVFVRTSNTDLLNAPEMPVTVKGLTQTSANDLRNLIRADMADINAAGFSANELIYIDEGRTPDNLQTGLLESLLLALVIGLCSLTFFFPSIVFRSAPVQPLAPGQAIPRSIVKASGSFQQLKTVDPMEFGSRRRKFQDSVANLFTAQERWVGVYIHFVFTQKVYGIQVRKQVSDWAVIIKPTQIVSLEAGKLYGWRDRWAVNFRYKDESDREQTLLLAFGDPAAQAGYVGYLREKGYAISMAQY